MPNPIIAVAGIGAGSSLIGASKNAKATKAAAGAQVDATQAGIAEQRRQFDAMQELMAPFVSGGTDAFSRMANLAGVNGSQSQASVMGELENDPRMQYAIQSGEEALLANASATGGLRGGNTQAALAEMRPAIMSQMIDQTYAQLGGLASLGQASASGQASYGQNFANSTSQLLQSQGSAIAGGALGGAAAFNQGLGGVANAAGGLLGSIQVPQGASAFGRWGF